MNDIIENTDKPKRGPKPKATVFDKLQISREVTLQKQEDIKENTAQSVLDKFFENDEEYDARIAEIRSKDILRTKELKLKEVKIPGYRTLWASSDPKAKPSILDLRMRGYRAIKGHELVPTGHHSVDGAGFHILMAIPEDIALKREAALAGEAKKAMDSVRKAKTNLNPESDKDFMFEQNKFEKPKVVN
jgi:hypothetical protein